jgi:hypothetical protein
MLATNPLPVALRVPVFSHAAVHASTRLGPDQSDQPSVCDQVRKVLTLVPYGVRAREPPKSTVPL